MTEAVDFLMKDPEATSSNMNWKGFEAFVESAFEALGYKTQRNVRFRKPRAEIDLVSARNGLVFAVDCKHWKRTVGHASMLDVSRRQIVRAKRLVDLHDNSKVIPLIVTLHDETLHILENGIPIVPIHKISDFVLNWEEAKDDILIFNSKSAQKRLF